MGLDTTHNCWHGPYSSFNEFRRKLALQIGINLDEYIGYSDTGTKHLLDIKHDIMPLLNHSDCDGELSVEEASRIADGLTDILSGGEKMDHYLKEQITQFRNGCIRAVRRNETIKFQ